MDPTVSSTLAVVVLTTLPAEHDGTAFARQLVEEGLAACVNVLPAMESVYRWQGDVQNEPERQLVIKTRAERLDALEARVKALHPYDVPEFLVLPVSGGSLAYLDWLRGAVSKSGW
jgi:periplasmic divalent cation tolerance protein